MYQTPNRSSDDDVPLMVLLRQMRRKEHAKYAIENANKRLREEKRYGMFPVKEPVVRFGWVQVRCF